MYHKYDEDRIRDAKEDIDTLLVFVRITPPIHVYFLSTLWVSIGWIILGCPLSIRDRNLPNTQGRPGGYHQPNSHASILATFQPRDHQCLRQLDRTGVHDWTIQDHTIFRPD